MVLALTLPLTYGGCGGGGGNGGGGGGGDDIVIDANDIGGHVTRNGVPEAGVWVIAVSNGGVSTNDGAPGQFHKIVVTDSEGRYVVPDLPDATYDVWVRGYGLIDSEPVQVQPGELVDLEAVEAPSPQEAAAIYPANYWASLIELPAESEFPGTGPEGNGWGTGLVSQDAFISQTKLGCQLCHQLGT
ncbi:MAG: carboxypeptidase-like regulatory domain-containing protein, partial [Candidatus Dadabacteria bacterium]